MVNDDSNDKGEQRTGTPGTQQNDDETDNLSASNRELTGQRGPDRPSLSKADWEALDSNPDFESDFGYTVADWESFETVDNSDQVMFLPADESLVEEDAFIVANSETLRELGEYC
jgi:hypothetical protein